MHRHAPSSSSSPGVTVTRPVPDHLELEVVCTSLGGPSSHVEYRVYNFRTLRSGRVVRGDGWAIIDVICIAACLGATAWIDGLARSMVISKLLCAVWILSAALWAWTKSRTVLYQSVIPLPGLGVQLTTARGIAVPFRGPAAALGRGIVLSKQHTFIPLSRISTIIINEGLARWSVHFYLAVIKRRGEGVVVALDRVSPAHAVLEEVYHAAREILFDEYASDDKTVNDTG